MISFTTLEVREIILTYIRIRDAYSRKGNIEQAEYYSRQIERMQDKLHNNEFYSVP